MCPEMNAYEQITNFIRFRRKLIPKPSTPLNKKPHLMRIVRHAKHLAAIAAFTGISLSVAYAAPSYEPPVLSPLDTTSLDSESPLLDNFNTYLSAINAELPDGQSLALPGTALPTD